MKEILRKLNNVKMCLMAHPDNEEDSEFEDRISDLDEVMKALHKPCVISQVCEHKWNDVKVRWNDEIKCKKCGDVLM